MCNSKHKKIMPCLSFFNKSLAKSFIFILITLLGVIFFAYLGIWQIKRGSEKKYLINTQKQLALSKPVQWTGEQDVINFQRISLQGNYLDTVFLLDNQHINHELGYNVLSPLLLEDGKVVLVDRGWIKAGINRNELPDITINLNKINIEGSVYKILKKPILLGKIVEKRLDNIIVIEAINFNSIKQILHKNIHPFIIHLDKSQPHGFVREWNMVSISPQRHFAYAFQWFALALCVLIIYIMLNIKYEYKQS